MRQWDVASKVEVGPSNLYGPKSQWSWRFRDAPAVLRIERGGTMPTQTGEESFFLFFRKVLKLWYFGPWVFPIASCNCARWHRGSGPEQRRIFSMEFSWVLAISKLFWLSWLKMLVCYDDCFRISLRFEYCLNLVIQLITWVAIWNVFRFAKFFSNSFIIFNILEYIGLISFIKAFDVLSSYHIWSSIFVPVRPGFCTRGGNGSITFFASDTIGILCLAPRWMKMSLMRWCWLKFLHHFVLYFKSISPR